MRNGKVIQRVLEAVCAVAAVFILLTVLGIDVLPNPVQWHDDTETYAWSADTGEYVLMMFDGSDGWKMEPLDDGSTGFRVSDGNGSIGYGMLMHEQTYLAYEEVSKRSRTRSEYLNGYGSPTVVYSVTPEGGDEDWYSIFKVAGCDSTYMLLASEAGEEKLDEMAERIHARGITKAEYEEI
jgi:hypothetical protein